MPNYLQLGHNSDNLIEADGLTDFVGVVMSPVNYDPDATEARILPKVRKRSLDLVFDPQLYNPRSDKASLNAWNYFPNGFETANSGDLNWWTPVVQGLAEAALGIEADKICSPSILPRTFDDSYYGFSNQVYLQLEEALRGTTSTPYQTVIVHLNDIGRPRRAEQIASIVAQAEPQGVYLVVLCDVRPRLELSDPEGLRGLMLLIHYLEQADIRVLVSHSSSDHVLWKAAGATACSTGKFFNLRRFASSRFEDAEENRGGQLAYWFEEGLLAFLRQGDLIRLGRHKPDLIGTGRSTNALAGAVLSQLEEHPDRPWVALGWRHYLCWFVHSGNDLEVNGLERAMEMVEAAEGAWQDLQANQLLLMEETTNDGRWIRPWRIALQEFALSIR